jgi:tRNA-dihydrouridine synthase
MIGRASIGNPWFFKEVKHFLATGELLPKPSIAERVQIAKRHLEMATEWNGAITGLLETRRHYASYFKGIPDFKAFRIKMVTAATKEEVFGIFEEVIRFYQ